MLSSNMLLLILIPLIAVTFSTPTGFNVNYDAPCVCNLIHIDK
jgi:hypothetical protein